MVSAFDCLRANRAELAVAVNDKINNDMTPEDFTTLLLAARDDETLDALLEEHVFSVVPYIFREDRRAYRRFLSLLSRSLSVDRESIAVVGSAGIGFSLAPQKYPTLIRPDSDVDIVIVSQRWFDISWLEILRSTSRRSRLSDTERKYLDEHKDKNYVFGGWIWPDRITRVLLVGTPWFAAFRDLPRVTGMMDRSFGGRIFRTWDHARQYYRGSLHVIRQNLERRQA